MPQPTTSQQRGDKKNYLSEQSWFDASDSSLISLPLSETSAVWNKRTLGCFVLSEILPTFGSFGSALIGALVRSVCDNLCSAFKDTFSLTVLYGNCLAEWLLPHRPETAPPRSVTAAPSQLQEALCMSSRRSSSLPSSLQQWADPGEVRREANPSSIPQRQSTVAPFMQPALSASSAVWAAVSSLSLSLQQRDWLRPGRRSWPCCRARLRLSSAEALIA